MTSAIAAQPSAASSSAATIIVRQTAPRILLADDSEEVSRIVAALLEKEFEVVGLAKDGQEVLELVPKCCPNALVLDLFMPSLNGLETAHHIRASGSPTAVVILTVQDDPDFVEAAISVGALGYVLKPHINTDLVPAIWTVLQGKMYVSPALSLC